MSLGKWIRNGILAAIVVVAGVLIFGTLASRSARTIRMSILVPADAELGTGTAIVVGRGSVGSVTALSEPGYGLPLEIRAAARHPLWMPVVLSPGEHASAGSGPGAVVLRLDPSDSLLFLTAEGQGALALKREDDGTWAGRIAGGDTVRLGPGEILPMGTNEIRIGSFGQLRRADLSFSTRKLCPDQARGMFPSLAERDACRQRMLTGQVRVEFGGTLGLTKPMLVLKPAYGESGTVVQADSSRLPLSSRQDLQAELSQMLRYLNSPEAHAPAPRTHFEHTVARVNRTLVSVDSATRGLTTTIHTLHAAMLSKNGLGALALGDSGYRSLRSNLDNLARLTDTSGTLVEHAGLGKILTRSDSTMLLADSTMRAIRAQVDRLAPRIELAVEGTARTIEGAEGTLVSLKAAGEDIQAIKRGAQSAVPVAKKGGLLFGLTQLIVALAGVVYIIP